MWEVGHARNGQVNNINCTTGDDVGFKTKRTNVSAVLVEKLFIAIVKRTTATFLARLPL